MKNCRNIHPLLALYRDKGLTPAQEKKVEGHLKSCAQGRKEMEAFDKLFKSMATLPEPQPPRDLHERIMSRIQPGYRAKTPVLLRWKIPALGLAAAACLTLFMLVQYPDVMNPGGKYTNAPSSPSPIATIVQNQPMAVLPQTAKKETLFALQKDQTAGASNNAKPFSLSGGTASSNSSEDLDLAKAEVAPSRALAKKRMKSSAPREFSPEPFSSGANDSAMPPAAQASAPSNNNTSADAGSSAGGLEEKQQEFSASNASSAPMAGAAAPEANTVAALPPEAAKETRAASPPTTLYQSWNGSQETASFEDQKLITDAETFKNDWDILQPGKELPSVDFTTQAVVALLDAQRPTGGYRIEVSRLEETSDQLIVHYKTESPAAGSMSTQVLTWPWTLQVIAKPAKPLVFQKDP